MKKTFKSCLAASIACLGMSVTQADDIDLYVGGEAVTGAETNVLIFLDNSANWSNASGWTSTQGEAELDALKTVIDTLSDNINVGVMMHTRTGSTSGAYVRFAIRPMTATNRTALKAVFDDIKSTAPNAPQDKVAQSANGDSAIEEAFRYFNSLGLGFTAARDTKEDYTNNVDYYSSGGSVSTTLADKAHPASTLGSHAYLTSASTTYSGPSTASSGCAKNYLIWIGNSSLDGSTTTTRLTAAATAIGETATTTQISVADNSAPSGVMLDEWARFMYDYGVPTTITDPTRPGHYKENKILTYTVDVFPATSGTPTTCVGDTGGGSQQVGQHYIMQSTATSGGGKCYPATNTSQLAKALELIFAEIQAVNSVFASASLPVSVNTQGTYENQVYIGMFRPDGNARPRWLGNLKEYKFGRYCDLNDDGKVDVGEAIADNVAASAISCSPSSRLKLFLADRNNNSAIDQTAGSGFIDLNAVSYWTTAQTPGFWSFFPDATAGTDDSPDGPLVERGGAAFKLRNQFATGRNVYTCLGSCLTASTPALSAYPFTTSNTTAVSTLTLAGKTVSLTRSGTTVTATSSSAHAFSNGDSVTITGGDASAPSDYLGAFTIATTGPTSTTFTYSVTEKPASDSSGAAQVSIAQTQYTLGSIALSDVNWTTGAATATATLVGQPYSVGNNLLITGATQSLFNSGNGGAAVTATTANSFSYAVTVPIPVDATVVGKSQLGATQYTNSSVQRYQDLVVVMVTADISNNATVPIGASVTLSGVTPSDYNVSGRVVEKKGTDCNSLVGTWAPVPTTGNNKKQYYCFRLFGTEAAASVKAQRILNPMYITISRATGSTTATASLVNASDSITAGTTQLTISSSTGYDGTWTMNGGTYAVANNNKSFTFGPVTVTPAAPSGTYTATAGAGSTTVAASNLINWVRGMDVYEDENQSGTKTDVRASVHADVLHSRPLMLNYGSTLGVVGYYGSNDGLLHAIQGGTADTDGSELWSFIPEEFVTYSKLSRLYLNEPIIRFPNLQCSISPTPQARDYFWDGVISGYQSADGTVSTAPTTSWIYATMRRGGRAVYAFDVSTPSAPRLKWRITNSTTGFSDLAQTWSEVKIVSLKGVASGTTTSKLVAIFGAGYDNDQEDLPAGSTRTPTKGRGVYVVDADTGALLAFLQPPTGVKQYSFSGDVTPYDSDGDGYADRIYAADTGGNLFRFDLDQTQSPGTTWTTYHLAKLGDVGDNGGTDARKFMFPPALVPFSDKTSGKSGLMITVGSGDREKPLKNPVTPTCSTYYGGTASFGSAVQDRFYAVLDTTAVGASATTVNASPAVEADLLEVNANVNSLTAFSFSSSYKGWYITLKNDADANGSADEEKTVNAPQVVGGILYFATNTPQTPNISQGICSNLGQALGYAVNPYTGLPNYDRNSDGTYRANDYAAIFNGGGLPPTVTSGVVMIGGQPYYGIIGGGGSGTGGNAQGGDEVKQDLPTTRKKVFWYYGAD